MKTTEVKYFKQLLCMYKQSNFTYVVNGYDKRQKANTYVKFL